MLKFIKSIPDIVSKLMGHLETSAIMDLILKLISLEEYPDGAGVIEWLHEQSLIGLLIQQLDPNNEPEVHATAAEVLKAIITISASNPEQSTIGPNALSQDIVSKSTITNLVDKMLNPNAPYVMSTLTAGVGIFIELIRKNNSDLIPPPESAQPLPLTPLLEVLSSRLDQFHHLLDNPRMSKQTMATTMGEIQPLGQERFRIVEMYAEILHASNVARVNDGGSEVPDTSMQVDEGEASASASPSSQAPGNIFKDKFMEIDVVPKILDLFFGFPWNNFLHNVVFDVLQQILGGNNDPASGNWKLILYTFNKARLVKRILDAVEENEQRVKPAELVSIAEDAKIEKEEAKQDKSERENEPMHEVVDEKEDKEHRPESESVVASKPIEMSSEAPSETPAEDQDTKMDETPEAEEEKEDAPAEPTAHEKAVKEENLEEDTRPNNYPTSLAGAVAAKARAKRGLGSRFGYMGHLTLIAEEVVKCLERNPELSKEIPDIKEDLRWEAYVTQTLPSIREQYAAPLGGARPPNHSSLSALGQSELGAGSILSNLEITDNGIMLQGGDDDDDDDDELVIGEAARGFSGFGKSLGGDFDDGDEEEVDLGGDSERKGDGRDRFAQYLSQQMSGQAPDRFGSSDEDEEEDDEGHTRMMAPADEADLHGIAPAAKEDDFDEMEFVSGSGDSFDSNPFEDSNVSGESDDWPESSNAPTRFSAAFEMDESSDKNLTPADWNAEFQSAVKSKEKELEARRQEHGKQDKQEILEIKAPSEDADDS